MPNESLGKWKSEQARVSVNYLDLDGRREGNCQPLEDPYRVELTHRGGTLTFSRGNPLEDHERSALVEQIATCQSDQAPPELAETALRDVLNQGWSIGFQKKPKKE